MSLALVNSDRYAAPDFSRLVVLAEAAAAMGFSADHLSRNCREKLQYSGDAMFVRPPEGGPEKWFIYRSYHPALSHPLDARFIPADLTAYSGPQRDQAMQRACCVDRLRKGRSGGKGSMRQIMDAVMNQARREFPDLPISKSQLYDWDARYRHPADLWKLVDSRGGNRRHDASDKSWDAFKDFFLHQNQPSIRHCWNAVRDLAAEHGWTWCSYKACARAVDSHIPPDQQLHARQPAKWREQSQPYHQQDVESWRPGELWIGDHKELDLICRWKGKLIRPWLTVWKDWRTRKVCGWVLSDNPNSTTILAALRHGLMDPTNLGGPEHVWIDNGKDYDAWLFHGQTKKQRRARIKVKVDGPRSNGILPMLGIEAHFSLPYCPNGKARLERWFGTLKTFCTTFETYTGDSIENKPARLNEILKNPKLIPSFESVYNRIGPHIAGANDITDHQINDLSEDGLTISPNEAFNRWVDKKLVLADPGALDLLMQAWHKPVTMTRNGIAISLHGRSIGYGNFDGALDKFKALSVAERPLLNVSYDPHNLNTIRVYDSQFKFICEAAMNQVGGRGPNITKEHVATMQRNKALHDRSLRHVAEYGLTSTMTTEEQLQGVASREAVESPASIKMIQTPLDGQAEEIQFRQAAGGEVAMQTPMAGARQMVDKLRANLANNRSYSDE